jgi:hypothetical protein
MRFRRCQGGSGIVAMAAVMSLASFAAGAEEARQLERLDEVPPSFRKCWKTPEGLRSFERTEITARFSIKRNGELIGEPRITFSSLPPDTKARELLTQAAVNAVAHCTPVNVSESLGSAVAGRTISIRFIYEGRKGKGI